ncbi:putative GCN5-related N-acetyltransferase [Vibrio nigripulchritudo SFn27]|uniref:GCN5-related N-acetyltransferase n=1 Tax=Vibrio nigripulchritudo TaxID=28173 RepID=A0A9P1JLA8_9VIBR|nr:GCN5-related N-acetyltransferase [Vibrio nigripulchritudo]CBJ93172.1 putative GCN5-related N-acetyltransferase [Vibrio nigripulchritudo]CCN38693.1 putative GCN5-related N-acetyltransferase [Vibrio nigripulchritudo AM115]CCN45002.1 putative GCN5-related N-acetyltransferase [Vibrio nigripulchritudo FTn2]CCN79760.1 putative GCN5-related N-acetyltransferase [Vibrio nigripulchritudo SO65]CCN91983.1 putative GCN5-related N-acetyltransferase [Vibrio nigripulchritudo SFn27]
MLSKEMSLGTYDIELAQMCSDDIDHLHELSLAVRWPHRATDWQDLIEMGEGFVARDLMGRLICSMMYFPMANNFASIGMGISSPRLQSLGAGKWLAKHIQSQLEEHDVYLFATKDSLSLCLNFGFSILQPVFHFNGIVQVNLASTQSQKVQPIRSTDHALVEQLDSAAMGVNRERIIKYLLSISKGNVIYDGAQLKAFALYRKFGRGYVIGPIVAETQEQAVTLISPILKALSGQFVRIDTYLESGYFVDYINRANLSLHETATKMVRGKSPTPSGPARTLGLASQALG